ncbi:MAG: hypothetical protein N3E45_06300 [Oscillatoriaceae bacterium SKW80]|nr:hypothetical protein [Oscillatoriaceae bacterium SKYG93]MCX8120427.1 hypothetical protein [Oscillatoriaceae bacterium SKW80]MDW8452998.1 hypothetical protein [Oscillatoriaceae cyanobacterium SKYGB_i_bin93]HIK28595.1 hypothetical protein [Oscillatoriaceae cyanobacterium M7585_C2015_266]
MSRALSNSNACILQPIAPEFGSAFHLGRERLSQISRQHEPSEGVP